MSNFLENVYSFAMLSPMSCLCTRQLQRDALKILYPMKEKKRDLLVDQAQ